MSIADIKLFLQNIYPFELLSSLQTDKLVDNLEIVYYAENQKIENTDRFLYIVLKGAVVEKDSDGKDINFYGEKDSFDYRQLLKKTEKHFFTVEESVLYKVPFDVIREISQENSAFATYITKTTKEKLSSIASENPYLFARIKDIPLAEPLVVDSSVSIWQAVDQMTKKSALAILVRFDDGYGIVTDSDLRKKVILERRDVDAPISEIANRNIISVRDTDFLFDAIITMMKHNIKRVVVRNEKDEIVGVLNEVDILTQYSNQPQFIAIKIERAKTVGELKTISSSFVNTVRILHREGIRTRHIMKLVSEINQKMFAKLFEILATQTIKQNTCLIVMGSEGRGEQILRTDQDNGLIIKDGFDSLDIESFVTSSPH